MCIRDRRYIKENQAKGVYPVLVTPIARNTWRLRDQTYLDLLEAVSYTHLDVYKRQGQYFKRVRFGRVGIDTAETFDPIQFNIEGA